MSLLIVPCQCGYVVAAGWLTRVGRIDSRQTTMGDPVSGGFKLVQDSDQSEGMVMMSTVAWAVVLMASGLALIAAALLLRRDRFVDPMVDGVRKLSFYRDQDRASAVSQYKAVLTLGAVFGVLIVALGVLGLVQG